MFLLIETITGILSLDEDIDAKYKVCNFFLKNSNPIRHNSKEFFIFLFYNFMIQEKYSFYTLEHQKFKNIFVVWRNT